MVRVFKIFLFGILLSHVALAQDIHLTQYYFSPLNYNPAATGRFDGDYRIVGNYRSQWGAIMNDQFVTSSISYEQVFTILGQKFAFGGVFVHDNSGLANLTQNKLQVSAGYTYVKNGHSLTAGIQTGMLHKGINFSSLTFPNQFDNQEGEFNNALDNGQNFPNNNDYSADLNFGVIWGKQITDKIKPEVGVSFMHLNRPKETFLGNTDNRFPIRNIIDVQLIYTLNKKWDLVPTVLHMRQNKASEMLIGGLVKHNLSENKYDLTQVFGGFSVRNGFNRNYDAAAIIVGGKIQEFQLGLSYDINVSPLSSLTHYQGAFEISLIYIAKRTSSIIYNLPCDRY